MHGSSLAPGMDLLRNGFLDLKNKIKIYKILKSMGSGGISIRVEKSKMEIFRIIDSCMMEYKLQYYTMCVNNWRFLGML